MTWAGEAVPHAYLQTALHHRDGTQAGTDMTGAGRRDSSSKLTSAHRQTATIKDDQRASKQREGLANTINVGTVRRDTSNSGD